MKITSLGLVVKPDSMDSLYSSIEFDYRSELISIGSVNTESFGNTLLSSCFGAIFYGVYGVAYIEETDLCLGFQDAGSEKLKFSLYEGVSPVYAVDCSIKALCADVGDIYIWSRKLTKEAGTVRAAIERPNVYVDSRSIEHRFT